jgi:hypothetical protein
MRNSPSLRVRLAWGRKRVDGEGRAPPLTLLPTIPGEAEADVTPYPFLHICHTPEIAMEQKLLRNRGKDVSLPPLPKHKLLDSLHGSWHRTGVINLISLNM